MVLHLNPKLEDALAAAARSAGVTPEEFAVATLQRHVPPPAFVPQDDWERRLTANAGHFGGHLTNEMLGREEMYD